jgi:hypothetical protein
MESSESAVEFDAPPSGLESMLSLGNIGRICSRCVASCRHVGPKAFDEGETGDFNGRSSAARDSWFPIDSMCSAIINDFSVQSSLDDSGAPARMIIRSAMQRF